MGDIGDNRAKRSELFLYRIEEPVFTGDSLINVNAEKMTIHYEEGARDAETLMTDPFTGNMILLSKRERKVKYYDFPFVASEKVISSSGELNLTYLTGGDINSNGDILVKHYDHVYLLRNGGEASVSEMLLQAAWEEVNYKVEVQGEAICWGNDNRSYYTTAERRYDKPEPFYWYY